ncbi:MAG: hypothetical protein V1753_05160 [Pseudomonadota bacterium]
MKNGQLVFVTYCDENFKEGLQYALDLARVLNEGMTILLLLKNKVLGGLEKVMAAAAFAEANEHETALEILSEGMGGKEKVTALLNACSAAGVNANVATECRDVVPVVKDVLNNKQSHVDMVILSPNIMGDDNVKARKFSNLLRTASRPIITMARQSCVAV